MRNEAGIAGHLLSMDDERVREAAWIKMMHDEADRDRSGSRCYFIGGKTGPIKIGHSTHIAARLCSLQAASPLDLTVLASCSGGRRRERAFHVQFRQHRQHGEWFARHPDIMALIRRIDRGGR